jgi:dynein heavy chain
MDTGYEEIVANLLAEPLDSSELQKLTDFSNECGKTLNELQEQLEKEVCVRVRFLLNNDYRWSSREDSQLFLTTFNWPGKVQQFLQRSWEVQAQRKRELQMLVEQRREQLLREFSTIAKKIERMLEFSSLLPPEVHSMTKRVAMMNESLVQTETEAEYINEHEALLDMEPSDFKIRLSELSDDIVPIQKLWTSVNEFMDDSKKWKMSRLLDVNAESAEMKSDGNRRLWMKLGREVRTKEKYTNLGKMAAAMQAEVNVFLTKHIPLMHLVANPGLKARHWDEIKEVTGLDFVVHEDLNLNELIIAGLHDYVELIEDICVRASKEYSLEKSMDKMEEEWTELVFGTKVYRNTGTSILSSVDEIQQLLDDQIVKTQAMQGSRFIGPYLERMKDWEKTLVNLQDIMDNWLKFQSTWLYLEPIFSSDDIMRQMPIEGKLFKGVDRIWRTAISETEKDPRVLSVAKRVGLLESLIEANATLDTIQKGLNDYLETKRLFFPRFFFLSNDELLEILAETKDPLRVNVHMKKCFEGISSLNFEENLDITAFKSSEGEVVPITYENSGDKVINPSDSGGNVEVWLVQVENMMCKTIAHWMDMSMVDRLETPRIEWTTKWQGQVVLAVNQAFWTKNVESSFEIENGVHAYWEKLCAELMETVNLVRGKLSKLQRKIMGALVVMDVHNRDTVSELHQMKVSAKNEFDWLAQLRYYWNEGGPDASAKTGKPHSTECRMINAMQYYAYEYLGCSSRLVITPLTDRCYRTLIGAIYLNLGGAPEGPAGTGKTETVKDLAKALAIQCVVTNCSDGLDYLAMGKFFKGLASSGAWACFDEFNRIQLEVLSVIAQQIQCIQLAKSGKVETFEFEGTELRLNPTCCPYITMNPGYAGRAELPDNLKVLFRTVAMMVPDYAMISEIILYSNGYTMAKGLAQKIVMTYKLCSEQLSSQKHYDYGMRAVIAVLMAAGNLKRVEGESTTEDVLVLRSIVDVNLPKFLSPDVPLFEGIVGDLFPGTVVVPPNRDEMMTAIHASCVELNLQPHPFFLKKIIEIYEMMVVRHGFMIVGDPLGGKTSAYRILARSLTMLHKSYPEDKRWTDVTHTIINPKAITMGQLYGEFDDITHEWTDGILAISYRNFARNITGKPADRKWLVLDGPVDAIWIENMNTVLDDNKKLCLMSGEIIAMTDVMSMMFEPMDLLVASPATVSRCGMVYLEPEQLGWRVLYISWLHATFEVLGDDEDEDEAMGKNRASDDHHDDSGVALGFNQKQRDLLTKLVDWMMDPCIAFVRREVSEQATTVDGNLVRSFMNIFESSLKSMENHSPRVITPEVIECTFLFSLVWSVGAGLDHESRVLFSTFLQSITKEIDSIAEKFPATQRNLVLRKWTAPEDKNALKVLLPIPTKSADLVYDFTYKDGRWQKWTDTLDTHEIDPDATFSSVVVPTANTAQAEHLVTLLIVNNKPLLLVGPTGTGKSCYINSILTKTLDQEKYTSILIGFSAKTSANMTQNIVDGRMDRRRKGVYGPPVGKKLVMFVDDLNMPEVETYGAQPPIELLRTFIDHGGWYDLKLMEWRSIVDTTMIAAMGPPGGGRSEITPRMMRHFNLISFTAFNNETLKRIFNTIYTWYFKSHNFSDEIVGLGSSVVEATLDVYTSAMASLLPTPQKSHYTFNLRDFSRIMQGILLVKPNPDFDGDTLVRLWFHESLRVIGDRLIEEKDSQWFLECGVRCVEDHFRKDFQQVFSHLDVTGRGACERDDMRRLFFGEYTTPESNVKNYVEAQDLTALSTVMDGYLADYNAQSRKPMGLVLFLFAIEHTSRIARILGMPGGNALLIGVGGSGRQSLTRLGAFIHDHELKQIEISKNYGLTEWREDLKLVITGAGNGQRPLTFLFSDTQIQMEIFVEDINNMLNSGEVPNLFPADEKIAIVEGARPHARTALGKNVADNMTPTELYAFFISRVRKNMHIVLAFSPIGSAFRDRLRKFPSLINCCTIDWFTSWPTDALMAVAERFLSKMKFDTAEVSEAIVGMCQTIHQDSRTLTQNMFDALRRVNYITPTSYLELIQAFQTSLGKKRDEVMQKKKRYENGVEKVDFATENVQTMQKELEDLQPVLADAKIKTDNLMADIQEKLPGVEKTRADVSKDAAIAEGEATVCKGQKESVEADLAKAIPALESAIKALNTLTKKDIDEVRNLQKPPMGVRLVCEAVCVMLEIKAARIPDPEDPSRRIMDYWGPSQKMLNDPDFINRLKDYDKDNIPPRVMKELRKTYIPNEAFTPERAAKASKAAEGLCKWCCAMDTYDDVVKVVGPKREALKIAEAQLSETMGLLESKQAELHAVEMDLKVLEDNLEGAQKKKESLVGQVDLCGKKLERAETLIESLGGEKARWATFATELGEKYTNLTGDVLIAAAAIAYLGPFTAVYRTEQIQDWMTKCKELNIPCNPLPSLVGTLGEPVTIRQWHIDGLPSDAFSEENGIIVFNSRRWPLMIDPQGQANKWVRNMEKENKLQVVKLTDGDYLRTIENAVQFGNPVLMENVAEELDPSIEPLLLKQVFKQEGMMCIRLGDSTVEYSDQFRFYITTKLRNPHYLPEISVKVTLLNFMITPEGLEDQLLGIVVAQERPDLQEVKDKLVVQSADNARKLKEIEDQILHILASSEGNILEDESAINTLNGSKILSDEIKIKQVETLKTEKEIDEVRQGYQPVAYSSQVLFFCIAELANIEPVYQYSLGWFIHLFVLSIKNSSKSNNLPTRLKALEQHFKFSLYSNVCRSLLEKDKLLFAFLLTINIMQGNNEIDATEWYFFLTGGVGMDNPHPNPVSEWLSDKQWGEVCRLSELPAFMGLKEDFGTESLAWKEVNDSTMPHDVPLPAEWDEKLSRFQKMLVLRTIRPDKVSLAVQSFVVSRMGEPFVKPPPFDLLACYEDSSSLQPLVFILSPGSDPMAGVLRLAEGMKVGTKAISLGQGQGPIACRMIDEARKGGSWVILQNCHLAPSWMPELERITEEIVMDSMSTDTSENTHDLFRMWCTTYPSEIFPVSILQNGVKMTNEPPKGLRANLIGSYKGDLLSDRSFFESCSKPKEFKCLAFSLCFFHALVQERRMFGPLGWNIPYEFNESDLVITLRQLSIFLDENDEVPYKALNYTCGECNYGGRVTDDKDRRLLSTILIRFYNPTVFDDEHAYDISRDGTGGTGDYIIPSERSYDDYLTYLDTLPLVTTPEIFGMHENANITKDQNETNLLFKSILLTQATGGGGGGGGGSSDAKIQSVGEDILNKMPPIFDIEAASIKYEVRWDESMNTVLVQELLR